MAARSDAAATPGPKNGIFMSVSLVSSSSNCLTLFKNQKTNTRKHIYDRQSLLDIDNVYKHFFMLNSFFIIAGDFNHANLKTVLPKFYQHVNFATRGNNTLDFVYTTVKNAYKAEPRPHLGYSDHISVMLTPAYRPLLKLAKPVQKQITVWPDNATSALQDCFQDTDWNMFKEAATYNNHTDLQEYTETVTAYIKNCIDDVTVTKTITTRANRKPWMTAEVRGLLKTRDEAFRSGDKAALKTVKDHKCYSMFDLNSRPD